jgi:DNA-binding transcriptional regulator YdaS (Cro superfamily)
MNMKPLIEAIGVAGSQTALAKKIGVRQSHISNWIYRDKKVPAEMVLKIERATGISRHKLRPDIYPIEQTPTTA